jgi:hypothetical protein
VQLPLGTLLQMMKRVDLVSKEAAARRSRLVPPCTAQSPPS